MCGFPKDNFYYYQAQWSRKPIVHVFPHWNWPSNRIGEEINVWVHSNCDEVELWLNDKSLGRKRVEPNSHSEWKVKYQLGVLLAKGYRNSQEVATDRVETTGEPAMIELSADRQEINADGEDVSVLYVAIKDAEGRIVPTSNNLVKFEVSGDAKIIGVGNGDRAAMSLIKPINAARSMDCAWRFYRLERIRKMLPSPPLPMG